HTPSNQPPSEQPTEAANEAAQSHLQALADPNFDLVAYERNKIQGAIRTDFILSAEIIVISLGTVGDAGFWQQLIVLTGISVLMTLFVYGLVAGIVKLDDAGLLLTQKPSKALQKMGGVMLAAAPKLMKLLSVLGTAAMFTVGGAILVHGVPVVHHLIEHSTDPLNHLPAIGTLLGGLSAALINALLGVAAGGLIVGCSTGVNHLIKADRGQPREESN
ncbi:MAG: DUF808 family protein, partial [Oceanobacter sp.]